MRSIFKGLFFCLVGVILFSLPERGASSGFLNLQEATTSDFVVSTDSTEGLNQNLPATATDRTSRFVVVWADERNGWGDYDIYAQLYNLSGSPQGTNFKVNTDTGTSAQIYPSVSMDASGDFVVVWEDNRNGNSDIYAQRFTSSGSAIGVNFRVDDDTTNSGQYAPDVVMKYHTGSFVITWRDERNEGQVDVLAQMFKPNGDTLGEVLKVNDDFIGTSQASPAIAMDDSGNFVITWDDQRGVSYDIFAQYYFYDGTTWGANFLIGDNTDGDKRYPDIAMNGSGYFAITWDDERNGNRDIYAERYDSLSLALDPSNFRVDNDEGGASQFMPSVSMNEAGDFVIAWNDERLSNSDIYAQRYNFCIDSLEPEGTNYFISDPAYAVNLQTEVAVVMTSDKICYTWTDNRQGFLTDIFAKIADWGWSEVSEEEETVTRPSSFELFQNYPNPFNPITSIRYAVRSSQFGDLRPIHTTLNIYNVLGQMVRTLVDEGKVPGEYQVIWDGKDDSGAEAASGVYFYQLKTADQSYSKKMVLMH